MDVAFLMALSVKSVKKFLAVLNILAAVAVFATAFDIPSKAFPKSLPSAIASINTSAKSSVWLVRPIDCWSLFSAIFSASP